MKNGKSKTNGDDESDISDDMESDDDGEGGDDNGASALANSGGGEPSSGGQFVPCGTLPPHPMDSSQMQLTENTAPAAGAQSALGSTISSAMNVLNTQYY